MKKILVTGAGGLVGYDAAKALKRNQNYKIFTTFHSQSNDKYENALQIDLGNTSIEKLKIEFDCIVHCAAQIPNSLYSDKQAALINRNIDDNIISYCSKHKCKLIYISGTTVYGNKRKELLTEEARIDISSKYIQEKRNTEIEMNRKCASYCILRISSPYGSRQKNVTVLKRFVDAVCKGENLYYFGTGERTQNFIAVRDVACAVERSISYNKNNIFNIASESSISMKQLANLILMIGKEELDTNSEVYAGDNIDDQEAVRTNIDVSLAKKLLGWEPQIKLEEGIREWIRAVKDEVKQ